MSVEADKPVTQITIRPQPEKAGSARADQREGLWGEDGFTFGDFIDMINPLQHIPIISTIYRELTGDQIAKGARMVGGTLLGGAVGFAAALANSGVEAATGKDIGENLLAMVTGEEVSEASVAANTDSNAADEKAFSALTTNEIKPDAKLLENAEAASAPVVTHSGYDSSPPSAYNKKASKLYRMRENISQAELASLRYQHLRA